MYLLINAKLQWFIFSSPRCCVWQAEQNIPKANGSISASAQGFGGGGYKNRECETWKPLTNHTNLTNLTNLTKKTCTEYIHQEEIIQDVWLNQQERGLESDSWEFVVQSSPSSSLKKDNPQLTWLKNGLFEDVFPMYFL